MSTVREHLGLLWLSRQALAPLNPQYDHAWAVQAALFVGAHLDELIGLAGGADIEEWVQQRAKEIPADFPFKSPAPIAKDVEKDAAMLDFVLEKCAWIQWATHDDTFKRCQLWTQNEDENYIVLSGEGKSFATERDAIRAAMLANSSSGEAG